MTTTPTEPSQQSGSSIAETNLDRLLKDHWADSEASAPVFERTWSRAQRGAQQGKRRPRYAPGALGWAVAAALLVAIVLAVTPGPVQPPVEDVVIQAPADGALFAQLSRSTRWRAPSDRLLAAPEFIWGVPQINGASKFDRIIVENPQWL